VAVAQPTTAVASGEEQSGSGTQDQDEVKKSPEQVLEESRVTLDRMEATADSISRMMRGARTDKDVVKTLCLDDKLNQIDVAVRAAADRLAIIEAAVKSGETERLSHDDAVLSALGSRGSELAVEANQCIGEESGTVGNSELKVTFDPAIPEGTVGALLPPVLISQPPQAASPTL
jgi:hypothetical protein